MRELAVWLAVGGMAAAVLYAVWRLRGTTLRYVLAMAMAGFAALATTLYLAGPIASYVTAHMRFESPDGAADAHMMTFLAANALALVGGWLFGWIASGPFAGRSEHFER